MSTNDFKPENHHNTPEGGSGVMYSELPERVVADVRRAFGADERPEVPAWVGLGLIAEFQSQHKLRTGRSRAIKFAAIAAALAIAVTAGMHYGGFKVKPTPTSEESLATGSGGLENKSFAARDAAGGGGALLRKDVGNSPRELAILPAAESSEKLHLKSAGDQTAGNALSPDFWLGRGTTLDLDHNGRTDILDALILAKTIIDPAFYTNFESGFDVEMRKTDEPVGILLAKAESSWDLTKDGKVDDNDLEALVAEIVKIGGA